MILSSKLLDIPTYTGKVITTRVVLGEVKQWKDQGKYWQRYSYGDARSVDQPAFTMAGGAHHVGANFLGEMNDSHISSW